MFEEKYKIIKEIQNGNKTLLNEYIKDNLEYIKSFTLKYINVYSDYEELIQEGIMIFITCVYNYKFNKDFLTEFAHIRLYVGIRKYILNNLNQVINEEEKDKLCIMIYEKYINNPLENGDFKFTRTSLDIKINNVYKIIYYIENVNAMNLLYKNGTESFEDGIVEKMDKEAFVKKFIDGKLTELQKKIILLKYGFIDGNCYPLYRTAKMINSSKTAVYQNHKNAIKKLNKKYRKSLENYCNKNMG